MHPQLPESALPDLINAHQQQALAPEQFFQAWKKAILLAGPHYFGIECRSDINMARSKWDLCPDVPLIESAIGAMSHGEQVFIAALVSFYNDQTGGRLMRRGRQWPGRLRSAGFATTHPARSPAHPLQRLVAHRTLTPDGTSPVGGCPS